MAIKLPPHQLPAAHQKNAYSYSLKHSTLVEMLTASARNQETNLIFMDMHNAPHPFAATQLLDNAGVVARFLMARGLEKNDKVVLMMPTSQEFVSAFFGILLAGGVPVPVSQPTGPGHQAKHLAHVAHITCDCEAKFFITYQRMEMIIGGSDAIQRMKTNFIFFDDIFHDPTAIIHTGPLPRLSADDVALIQYTSGTTSLPKGVVLTHGNLLNNMHAIGMACVPATDDVSISWLPLYHDMGLIGALLTAIYYRVPLILMRPEAFIFKPHWWLENIGRFKATICVAPNFGYHYCTTRISDSQCDQFELGSWRIAMNGAEPIDRLTLKKFYEKFKPSGLRPNVFLPVYGMAENSLAVTFPTLDTPTFVRRFDRQRLQEEKIAIDSSAKDPQRYIDLVSVGYPIVGQEIRIADTRGRTLSERSVGEILVKGASLTQGYYRNAEATQQAIKDGWLHTGDLGFILEGRLFVSGRIKEMIIKRGQNIYPYDVERIAATTDGVRLGSSVAFAVENHDAGTEDLVLVCETILTDLEKIAAMEKEIGNKILSTLGIRPDRIIIVTKGTVPKTTSGKLQRIKTKRMYLTGTLLEREAESTFQMENSIALAASH